MWQGAQGSYKEKGFSPEVIWIHIQIGLRYKSHLPGIFKGLQEQGKLRDLAGCALAQHKMGTGAH